MKFKSIILVLLKILSAILTATVIQGKAKQEKNHCHGT